MRNDTNTSVGDIEMGFYAFMVSIAGRATRIIAGAVVIYLGFAVIGGMGGTVVGIVGVLPFMAGVFDWCIFAPLAGLPIGGTSLRAALNARR